MNKLSHVPRILAVAVTIVCVSAFASACASAPATPTEPPPTFTPVVYPATYTPGAPLPPTLAVPVVTLPPFALTRTPDAETQKVIAAFLRTGKLTVYYADMNVTLNDPTGSLPGSKPGEPFSIMRLQGRSNQGDSEWRLSGFFIVFLGGDADRGIRFLTLGDRMYIRGPLPFFGAKEDRWYVTPKAGSNFNTNSDPGSLLRDFPEAGAGMPIMHAVGQENLDNKACTKYQGDEREATALFAELARQGELTQGAGSLEGTLRRGTMNVWVCEDGYVHQLEMALEVAQNDKPDQIVTLGVSFRMNDMNVIVPLDPPPDAIPLPNPFVLPTSVPPRLTPPTPPTS